MRIAFNTSVLSDLLASILGIALLSLWSTPAQAQFKPEQVEKSIVRVVVGAGTQNARAASGFVWQEAGLVVTTLHAVPGGLEILVKCRGENFPASVAGVLPQADLIVLKTAPMNNCVPISASVLSNDRPETDETLYTLGHFESAQSMSKRNMIKQWAQYETLQYLTSGSTREMLATYNIPAIDLDIYYVQGGLLPGYSGAPVFDAANRLVGIVDGGLNKGASNYNWVIPGGNLLDLMDQMKAGRTEIPPEVAKMQGILFSSPAAEEDETSMVAFTQHDRDFRFVRTKTASLYELSATADDPEGLRSLLTGYATAAGFDDAAYRDMAQRLVFDIYEDVRLGLIIAVPENQGLEFTDQDEEKSGDFKFLVSEASGWGGNGYIQYEVFPEGYPPAGEERIDLNDPEFANKLAAGLVADCDADEICTVDESTFREIPFADGTKIVKVGVEVVSEDPTVISPYDYYSFAVKDDMVFRAYARIHPSDDGLYRCDNAVTCPSDPEVARVQLAQLLSVHLTTFR